MHRLCILAMLLAACGGGERPALRDVADTAGGLAAPVRVAAISGFDRPESVLHDAQQDVYFISNITGDPPAKDGSGFISRMRPDGTLDSLHFVQGGRGGVTLHAPKGLALTGDTLWVADIDAIRGFDRRSGIALATVEVPTSRFLNDLAVGPDGMLYATESGFRAEPDGSGREAVYRIGPGHRPEKVLTEVPVPNGIARTKDGAGLLLASFGDAAIREWRPVDGSITAVGEGPGQHDGLAVLDDGRIIASSWADSSVVVLGPGAAVALIEGLPSPADFEVDRGRGRLVVPLLRENRVEIWAIR
ncbi:MAG: SMP-30/gluconolactonase/LRE family protein [Gemmatimonadales bacterium]